MNTSFDAMVLCAGLGTRLRPLTLERAKPAVPLLGRPLVGWSMQRIAEAGLSHLAVNTHWLPDTMESAARSEASRLGLSLSISHEEKVLDTGGGLWKARAEGCIARDRPLLVMNGDVYFDIDLRRAMQTHLDSGALATMVVRPMPPGAGYSPIEADASGRIGRIASHGSPLGTEPLLFTGVQILSPEALELLPEGPSGVIAAVYAPLLSSGARVQAFVETGRWLDLGDPSGYLAAHLNLAPEGRVDESAFVHPDAIVERSYLGAGSRIEAGAVVKDCVLWEGTRVAEGEELERTILTSRSRTRV